MRCVIAIATLVCQGQAQVVFSAPAADFLPGGKNLQSAIMSRRQSGEAMGARKERQRTTSARNRAVPPVCRRTTGTTRQRLPRPTVVGDLHRVALLPREVQVEPLGPALVPRPDPLQVAGHGGGTDPHVV